MIFGEPKHLGLGTFSPGIIEAINAVLPLLFTQLSQSLSLPPTYIVRAMHVSHL